MPLALPFDGVAPLLLYVVFHPFELGHTSVERKVLVESLELGGEVSLLIATSPMAVLRLSGTNGRSTPFSAQRSMDMMSRIG
jgi:hypothetical protein